MPMQRIVQGILFEGEYVPNCWDVRTFRGNGVMERSARQVVAWRELGPVPPLDEWDPERDAVEIESRRQESLRKSAQRAKQMCRRIIITEGFNELLTLTYRENQGDRALCKKHFAAWVRKMKRALGKFRYCASFERQERGAMHVHIACHKLPAHAEFRGVKIKAWKLGTECWRSIVGNDNGLCFVGGATKFGGARRNLSLAKMAAYVSKYIMKDFEDAPEESNRYSRSNSIEVPKAEVMRLNQCSLRELIELTFEQGEGDIVVSHRVGRFGDSVWLVTEKDPDHVPILH